VAAHRRLLPVAVVWGLFAVVGFAIFITYARLPPASLYNVSRDGLAGGASRALVFSNYPVSLVAISLAWLAADRVGTERARWAAAAATVLCAVTAWPGVVDQHDLDAKPVNVLPAVGVGTALVLTVLAPWERVGRLRLDPLRIGIAVLVWLTALVWVAAVLGFYVPGDVLLGEDIRRGGDGHLAPAVHRGDHEGLDAALLISAALILTRYRARVFVTFLLSLALAYGLFVEWRDFWFEQVTKRGWTDWTPPSVLTPHLSVGWALIVAFALLVTVAFRRLEAPSRPA
jgi:hypothetical protein